MVAITALFALAAVASSAVAAPLSRRAVSFKDIDITRTPGNGPAAEAAAARVCNDGLTDLQALEIATVSIEVRDRVFQPALLAAKKAGNKAKAKAIDCQLNRNKVLDNFCSLVKETKRGNQDSIALRKKNVQNNSNKVTAQCAGADESLFITP